MSNTVEQLTTQIEELEKRIRSISSSHTTLSQIISIRDCIEQIKEYLLELNDSLGELENSASDTELQNLKDRVTICENDISAIQTDLGSCQDDIADVESEISAINSSLGEHTTTITNLQTTQTNLQTTQSSQASTINNINSRLTTAENNISTLTGGVDVGEIDSRLNTLENNTINDYCCHRQLNFHNIAPSDNVLYTRQMGFSCEKGVATTQNFKLEYESTATGNLTFEVYEDCTKLVLSKTIDLAKHPYTFVFAREFYSQRMSNNLTIKISTTTTITYKHLDLWITGKNIRFYDYDKEVKVCSFNGFNYITKYEDSCIKCGRFTPEETFDINNLPISFPYQSTNGCFLSLLFAPYSDVNQITTILKTYLEEALLCVDTNQNFVVLKYNTETSTFEHYKTQSDMYYFGEYNSSSYTCTIVPTIIDSDGYFFKADTAYNNNRLKKLARYNKEYFGEVLCINVSKYIYYTETGDYRPTFTFLSMLALFDDGYVYWTNSAENEPKIKLGKYPLQFNSYATQNMTINVYLYYYNRVEKFYLTINPDDKSSYMLHSVSTFENCDCVYELLGNKLLVHSITDGWHIEQLITE